MAWLCSAKWFDMTWHDTTICGVVSCGLIGRVMPCHDTARNKHLLDTFVFFEVLVVAPSNRVRHLHKVVTKSAAGSLSLGEAQPTPHLNLRIDQLAGDQWDFRMFHWDASLGWDWSTHYAHALGTVNRCLSMVSFPLPFSIGTQAFGRCLCFW